MELTTTRQMEESLYFHFEKKNKVCAVRINAISKVFYHEIDFLIITKSNYLIEIEIKISKSDLKADILKSHDHPISPYWGCTESKTPTIKKQYFAIPHYLKQFIAFIPKHFGVLIVNENLKVEEIRPARVNKARALNQSEVLHIATLQARKYWYERVGTHL